MKLIYSFCRLTLILGVLVVCYCVVSAAVKLGGLFWIGLVIFVAAMLRRRHQTLTAFGTARWANANDLRAQGMLGATRGLILGQVMDGGKPPLLEGTGNLFDIRVQSQVACEQFIASIRFGRKPKLNPALVRLPKAVHTAAFAPTGVGKGVSCVVPFLLTSDESAVVVDFKGENFRLTAEHRRRAFGHRIVVLDPMRIISQTPDTFNPVEFIDKNSPTAIDECRDLAEALVVRTGHEKDPHWTDSAEAWIGSLIALVVQYGEPEDRSLQTVRTLLTNPEKLEMAIKLMCASDAWKGMLARMGYQLTHFKDKELGSTLTTTNRFLRFLDTLAVAESTRTSSFDPADLIGGKLTIYLVLPPEHMRAQSPLLRMWIGSLLRAVVRGGLQEKNKVHFVLDEAASLGHMEALDDAVDKYRGYGVRLQFYLQSMDQLKKIFPDGRDQTLLSNVSQVFFGVNDLATAEYVSNRLGEGTIVVKSGGTGTGMSWQNSMKGESSSGSSSNASDNWAQHGRKLLKPEEVLALSDRVVITFTPGVPPICTRRIKYYEEPRLLRKPGMWKRFKAVADVVVFSVAMLLAALLLAMECSDKTQNRLPVEHPPIRYRQSSPHHRKTGGSWQNATSSRL
jgi:type IV secretion system protein VirD4